MEASGILRKMKSQLGDPVHYWLNLNKEAALALNPFVGSEFAMEWTGEISCIRCGRNIKKTFGQGFCYPCFRDAPEAAPCIVKPELCEAHLGKGRDPEWEEVHHNQPHVVYLALTSDVKVGVTRATQVPTRWIDQGAWQVIALAQLPYRQLAGLMELELKQYVSDRTDWRKMLTHQQGQTDLLILKEELTSFLPAELAQYATHSDQVQEFHYPVIAYPASVSAIDLEKERKIKRPLIGIRGQYLIFEDGKAINLRKYSGYHIAVSV